MSGAAFIAIVLLAGELDPGYSHLSEGISALASDESQAAGLMTLGFVFLGVTLLSAGRSVCGLGCPEGLHVGRRHC